MMTHIRLQLSSITVVCTAVCIIGGIFVPTIALACEGAGEEEAGLSVTPNPLIFTPKSANEESVTLAAAGAAGDEAEVIAGGVGAIKVTEGPAGWVKLKGSNCASTILKVGGANCVEKMELTKFPKVGELFRAEYDISWKSIKPASIILHTTEVKLRAEN